MRISGRALAAPPVSLFVTSRPPSATVKKLYPSSLRAFPAGAPRAAARPVRPWYPKRGLVRTAGGLARPLAQWRREGAGVAEQDEAPRLVGVVGAGTMGAGIAEVAARAGVRVRLYDLEP